jgi:hypothetical protein
MARKDRLAEIARDVADLVQPDAALRSVTVHFSSRPDCVPLWGDPDLLRQALMKLAVNAFDAMPHGGTLSFDVDLRARDALLTVADTGTGIPESQRDQVFQLYFTTKKNGSGLGLAMVYRAVQLHGGSIELESEPGQGTRFDHACARKTMMKPCLGVFVLMGDVTLWRRCNGFDGRRHQHLHRTGARTGRAATAPPAPVVLRLNETRAGAGARAASPPPLSPDSHASAAGRVPPRLSAERSIRPPDFTSFRGALRPGGLRQSHPLLPQPGR